MKLLFYSFLLISFAGCCPKPQVVEVKRPHWEYKVVKFETAAHEDLNNLLTTNSTLPDHILTMEENKIKSSCPSIYPEVGLDRLGDEGWELASSYTETETVWPTLNSGVQPNVRTGKLVLIFKRPIL